MRVPSRCIPLGVTLAMAALCACTSAPRPLPSTAQPAPKPQALPVSSAPRVAAEHFFGSYHQLDEELGNPVIAYWRVETETTPSAAAALEALAFMGRKYANQGRAIVLRMDVFSHGSNWEYPVEQINVIWNPTGHTVTVGLSPPGNLSRYSAALFVQQGFAMRRGRVYRISPVTTETLTVDSDDHQNLLRSARHDTGMR